MAIIATKVVTTSGLQKWNGAAETLNKNPTAIYSKKIVNDSAVDKLSQKEYNAFHNPTGQEKQYNLC